jgi:hypothetical protein
MQPTDRGALKERRARLARREIRGLVVLYVVFALLAALIARGQ